MMRQTLGIILLATILLLSACQSKSEQLSEDELIAEEWAVYIALMDEGQVILNETTAGYIDDDKAYFLREMPSLTEETYDNYIAKQQTQGLALPAKLGTQYQLISQAKVDEVFGFSDDLDLAWKRFYQLYPNSDGYMAFSRVGFNTEITLAFVYIQYVCGPECGGGIYYVLRRTLGKWQIVDQVDTWVS
jgi:hypothetical protein